MDITPHQLRDCDIKPAFRGYDSDEVNELLERAAATIETQGEKIRLLTERVATAPAETARGRDTEDLLHRTLELAQRACDDALAEAQEKARVMMSEAETQSAAMVAEAKAEVRRISEVERRAAEEEIVALAARRDVLRDDVRALEQWQSDYRARVVTQIESDLAALNDRAPVAPAPQPEMSNVELPEAVVRRDSGGEATMAMPAAMPSPLVGSANQDDEAVDALVEPAVVAPAPAPAMSSITMPRAPQPRPIDLAPRTASDRPSYLDEVLAAPMGRGEIDLKAAESEGNDLDDDQFFATLRDAVRDDAPLGPRDEDRLFDQDRERSPREIFKRRR